MSQSNRLSQSLTGSWKEGFQNLSHQSVTNLSDELVEDWLVSWKAVLARDLIDINSKIVEIDAHASVEEACELLLSEATLCLAIRAQDPTSNNSKPYLGLFDYADVNAFLTLAATRHTLQPDDIRDNDRIQNIVAAAKAGQVPVHLVSNLSGKNPIEVLSHDANLISLLEIFARGTHRVLLGSAENASTFMGMISDQQLLSWFDAYARHTPSFQKYLSNPIGALDLPSLNLNADVISTKSTSSILDAMKLMSEQGVSSVAVIEDASSHLLSAVSVTDVGKIVVPSQSNQILAMPLHHFIAHIKEPDGSLDGVDKYPVYSVVSSSPLYHTIGKILASQYTSYCNPGLYLTSQSNMKANAHRVFVTRESALASPVLSASSNGNVTGLVSIVDILSHFARVAKIPNVDPTQMQRHRRASSASSHTSLSDRDVFLRSRSNSKTSVQRSPNVIASSPQTTQFLDNSRSPVPVLVLEPLSIPKSNSRRSLSLRK